MFSRLQLQRACSRVSNVCTRQSSSRIALDSADFPVLRARSDTFVDKTGAIADLLASMHRRRRVFFARPRKFGKSLMLSIAGEMLAAGALPAGVAPWPGYAPVDVGALFGGLLLLHCHAPAATCSATDPHACQVH